MDERARQRVLGTHGRAHPPGFQYWESPNPSRTPASRFREEKGAVSKRIHSEREHHLLASEMDLRFTEEECKFAVEKNQIMTMIFRGLIHYN